MKPGLVSDAEASRLIDLYLNHPMRVVAEMTGYTVSQCERIIRPRIAPGAKKTHTRWMAIAERKQAGATTEQLCEEFNCARGTIKRALQHCKIYRRYRTSMDVPLLMYLVQRNSYSVAANQIGSSYVNVYQWCRNNGIKSGFEYVTTEDEPLIVALYQDGMPISEIAEKWEAREDLIEYIIEIRTKREAA